MLKKLLLLVLFPLLLLSAELDELLRLNFFGTTGVSSIDSKEHIYRPYTFQKHGVTKGDKNVFQNTLFGIKAELTISDALSLTGQTNSVSNGNDQFTSTVDWAYLKYETEYDLAIRLGLFPLPLFSTSELTYVGYARNWVRPALPFYGVTGLEDFAGVDLIYSTYYGYYDITLRASYGKSDANLPPMANGTLVKGDTDNLKIVSIKAENDYISVGVTYFNSDGTLDLSHPQLDQSSSVVGNLEFYSVEFKANYKEVVFEGGGGAGNMEALLPEESFGYLSLAYPVDELTPYLLYSVREIVPTSTTSNGQTAPSISQKTYSMGMRYDLMQGVALKTQIDRFDLKVGSPELVKASVLSDKEAVHVISVSLDVMF
jgi:hypothetical protein